MKFFGLFLFVTIVVNVESDHTFFGTSVARTMVHHSEAKYEANWITKRIETFKHKLTFLPGEIQRPIQGVLVFDKTSTKASANVTEGGLGHDFVTIRMKSEQAQPLHYDIYIYV